MTICSNSDSNHKQINNNNDKFLVSIDDTEQNYVYDFLFTVAINSELGTNTGSSESKRKTTTSTLVAAMYNTVTSAGRCICKKRRLN